MLHSALGTLLKMTNISSVDAAMATSGTRRLSYHQGPSQPLPFHPPYVHGRRGRMFRRSNESLNLGFPGRRWEVGLENIPATVFGSSLCVRHCIKHVMGITSFNHLRCPPSPTPPPNSYVEANPRHEGMRSWAFGRCGGHGRAVLMNGISALIVRDPTGTLYPVQHVRTQQEVGSLHRPPPSEEAPHQNLTVLAS